jgi:DNA-binding transcriptional ArsR family regulator
LAFDENSPAVEGSRLVEVMIKAMANPIRAKILAAVSDATFSTGPDRRYGSSRGVSVRQISAQLREPERRVRYHLDSLHDLGLVTIVDKKTRRGVFERYYIAVHRPLLTRRDMEGVSDVQQQRISIEVLKLIFADAGAALAQGSYDRGSDWSIVRIAAEVDEQGWKELGALQEDLIERAGIAFARALDRLKTQGEAPIAVTSASLLFERAGPDGPSGN